MAWLFSSEKIATLHKSRILQAVQKLRVYVGGFSRKRGHNRVAILESALFRVLSLFFS